MGMGTLISVITIIYIFYYTGNIVYDMFFKSKNYLSNDNNVEEFVLTDDVKENNSLVNISIDDVETLNNPISVIDEELELESIEIPIEENLKSKYAEEELIDKIAEAKQKSRERFKDFLNQAYNSVQLVKEINGQKIYSIN